MTELVWMKTYIGTEAALTVDLTAQEFGAYERLRRYYWQHRGLPDDDRRLMRITGVDPDQWEDVRSAICGLFEEGWRLPALDALREDAAEKRERKIAAGRKGAEKRWDGKRNGSANADANSRTIAEPLAEPMTKPMAEPLDNQWPSASASDNILYEERLAPTRTHARTRDPDALPIPENDSIGRDRLREFGMSPRQVEAMLPKLMAGDLTRIQIDYLTGGAA